MSVANQVRYQSDLVAYLKTQFKLKSETDKIPDIMYVEYKKMTFINGIEYESKAYEGGTTVITYFPIAVISFKEMFLLARIAYPEFFGPKTCAYQQDDMDCEIDEELTSLQLKKEGNRLMVYWGAAD